MRGREQKLNKEKEKRRRGGRERREADKNRARRRRFARGKKSGAVFLNLVKRF